ncbi:MAG: endo-1,4-beta-xylanase [Clostridia bacterium]
MSIKPIATFSAFLMFGERRTEPRLSAVKTLAEKLNEKGRIVGGGFQCHYGFATPSVNQVKDAMDRFVQIGPKSRPSEIDIEIPDKTVTFLYEVRNGQSRSSRFFLLIFALEASNCKNILPIARLSFLYFLVVFLIQLPNFVSFSN